MEKISINDWKVDGNELVGCINKFGLSISMGVAEIGTPSDSNIVIDEGSIAFILTIYSVEDCKKANCIFNSLEQTMYFINNYVTKCDSINDIANKYNYFCMSEDVIKNKGYTS